MDSLVSLFTRQHIGLIIDICSAIFLIFVNKSVSQYSGDKHMEDCAKRSAKEGFFIPTNQVVDKKRLALGILGLILGTVLAW